MNKKENTSFRNTSWENLSIDILKVLVSNFRQQVTNDWRLSGINSDTKKTLKKTVEITFALLRVITLHQEIKNIDEYWRESTHDRWKDCAY